MKELEDSIKHWEELCAIAQSSLGEPLLDDGNTIVFGEQRVRFGWRACALCQVFYVGGCKDCPVMRKTGSDGCMRTPYRMVMAYLNKKLRSYGRSGKETKVTRDLVRLMRAELRFLKSLRKTSEQKSLQEVMKKQYPVEIHYVKEGDGSSYVFAFHPDFGSSACSATGDTVREALLSLRKVRQDFLEHLIEKGAEIPKPSDYSALIVDKIKSE